MSKLIVPVAILAFWLLLALTIGWKITLGIWLTLAATSYYFLKIRSPGPMFTFVRKPTTKDLLLSEHIRAPRS